MLKAIAIFVAVAITAVCATVLLGYSSCQQSPEQSSETAKTEKTHEKYCTSSYRMFTVGLFDVKEFIHENRDDINAVSTIFIAAFTIILGLSWSRLFEQNLRVNKWSVCRVMQPSGWAAG